MNVFSRIRQKILYNIHIKRGKEPYGFGSFATKISKYKHMLTFRIRGYSD